MTTKDTPSNEVIFMKPVVLVLGIIFLLVSATFSGLLVFDHMGGLSLPGCGEGSGCADLANGVWGRVPGVNWPVSCLGFAYFIAAIVGWILCRGTGGVSFGFRWIVRIAALASLVFLFVMVTKATFCLYCFVAHLGNFAFWATMEIAAPRIKRDNEAPALALIIVFFVATLILFIIDSSVQARAEMQAGKELTESTQQIIDGADQTSETSAIAVTSDDPGFIGRYPSGPENAPIRIVIFSDYQCMDCKEIERQLMALLGERDDLLVSMKHFPFGKDCNPLLNSDLHPEACRAAAYAEAIGMIGGPEAFWRAHFWLFENLGSVSDQQLIEFLNALGISIAEFQQTLASPEISERIRADIEEGRSLGLYFTPMVFINGVQLRGYRAPNALLETVRNVAATNPPPGHSRQDTPDLAAEKYVNDWRSNSRKQRFWTPGSVTIDVIGDYTHQLCGYANEEVLKLIENDPNVIYRFHPFPFDKSCNSFVKRTERPLGCDAASLVEAARFYGGSEAGDAVGQMILNGTRQNANFYSPMTVNQAAELIDADPYDLQAIMNSTDVKSSLDSKIKEASKLIHRGIPTVYINGRNVPRWRMDGDNILGRVYELAKKESAQ